MLEEGGRENKDNKEPTIIGMFDAKSAFDDIMWYDMQISFVNYIVKRMYILSVLYERSHNNREYGLVFLKFDVNLYKNMQL
jgi:hypothetical protein